MNRSFGLLFCFLLAGCQVPKDYSWSTADQICRNKNPLRSKEQLDASEQEWKTYTDCMNKTIAIMRSKENSSR